MIKVYCDTGAYRKELSTLDMGGLIILMQFKYENKNKKIKHIARPANPTWKQDQSTWDEDDYTWDDDAILSPKRDEIVQLIGSNNEIDVKHLESAHLSKCHVFLTSDKDDIWSKRNELKNLLGFEVFHYLEDWEKFMTLVDR